MPNPAMHPYEEAADGAYCDAPVDGTRICAHSEGHPVHSGRADIDRIARALLT